MTSSRYTSQVSCYRLISRRIADEPPTRLVVVLVWLLALLGSFVYLSQTLARPSDQQLGDWLINFQGGVVRRGFLGEVLLRFGLDSDGLVITVLILQISSYLVVTAAATKLYSRTHRNWAWFGLILSPAFIAFSVLQQGAGFRKEVMGLAAVALAAVAGQSTSRLWARSLWVAAVSVFVVAVLAHESNLVAGIALLWLLRQGRANLLSHRFVITSVATLTASSLLSVVMSLRFPGTPATTGGICNSLSDVGFTRDICSGAIKAVGIPLPTMTELLWHQLYPMYLWYLPFLALALLPIVMVGFPRRHLLVVAAVLAAALPLFIISIDYGRWISLVASILSLLALSSQESMKEFRIPFAPLFWTLFVVSWSPTLVEYPLRQTSWVTLVFDGFRSLIGM